MPKIPHHSAFKMSVSFHISSQGSVTSKYEVPVITLSSDEESPANVQPMEAPKVSKVLDVAGSMGMKKTPTKNYLFDPLAEAYYNAGAKHAVASNKRTCSGNNGGKKKRVVIENDTPAVIILDSSDESSG